MTDDTILNSWTTFLTDHPQPWCWNCGRDEHDRPKNWYAAWTIQRAHLSAGSGLMSRRLDRRVACLLCPRCHYIHRHHPGGDITINGDRLPRITDANMIWLKQTFDAAFYDRLFLESIWPGCPSSEPPHQRWLDEYSIHRIQT